MRNISKKATFITLMLMFGFFVAGNVHAASIKYTNVKKTYNTYVKDSTQLKVKITNKKYKTRKIKWKSSNKKVVYVNSKGKIVGKRAGTAKITATISKTNKKVTCRIRVKKRVLVKKVSFATLSGKTVAVGRKRTLRLNYAPTNATHAKFKWTSSDDRIATVSRNGRITGIRPGLVKITAATTDGSKKRTSYKMWVTAPNGLITAQILNRVDLKNVNKIMIVAHPDDETLWGGGHLLTGNYLVICLTNGYSKTRTKEFKDALAISGDQGIILNYPDVMNGEVYYWEGHIYKSIKKDIDKLLKYKRWGEIVTHNPDGEYSHKHHKMTSDIVTALTKSNNYSSWALYYFGKYYDSDDLDKVDDDYKPLPYSVIKNKVKMVDTYASQQVNAVSRFEHMFIYEEWVRKPLW